MTSLILYAAFPRNSAFPWYFPPHTVHFSKHQAELFPTRDQLKCLIAGDNFPILKCIFS